MLRMLDKGLPASTVHACLCETAVHVMADTTLVACAGSSAAGVLQPEYQPGQLPIQDAAFSCRQVHPHRVCERGDDAVPVEHLSPACTAWVCLVEQHTFHQLPVQSYDERDSHGLFLLVRPAC